MVGLYGSKHNGKNIASAYTGWGFIIGFVLAIFMGLIVNLSIIQKQLFFDNGYDIYATVIDYAYFYDNDNSYNGGNFFVKVQFTDKDGNQYSDFLTSIYYPTEVQASAKIGSHVHLKTNGHGEFMYGGERPEVPIIMYILFAAFSVLGLVGFYLVIKNQWLISENRTLKYGSFCGYRILSFEKKRKKDRFHRLKIEVETKKGNRILYTHSSFTEGEAAYCFALPNTNKIYRVKYKGTKIIIVEDFDFASECRKVEKKAVTFENGKIKINLNLDDEEYSEFRKLSNNRANEKSSIEEQLTPAIRNKYKIGGRFVVPESMKVVGTELLKLYVITEISKLSKKCIEKKIKVFHNPTMSEIKKVDMSYSKIRNEEIGYPLSERDSINLLSKYGNWFELDGRIVNMFEKENVVVCEVLVPVFQKAFVTN